MGTGAGLVDHAGMVDARRVLPAMPIAVLGGLVATIPWLEGSAAPCAPVAAGCAGLVAVLPVAYGLMTAWSARAQRIVGYLAVVVLAVVVGAVLGLFTLSIALCGWSFGCDDETLFAVLALATLAAPGALVILYAQVDAVTLRRHSQRPVGRRGRGPRRRRA
jgi:MFS family permease